MHACIYIGMESSMVKIISISDEVYAELSKMKNGKSFTELFKILISECSNKGEAKSILSFLEDNKPISEDDANIILNSSEKGRKLSTARKSASYK